LSRHPCYFLPHCAPSSHFPSHPFSAFPSPRISPKPVNCILSHRAAPRRDREGLFSVRCRGGAALGRVRGVSAVCVGVCPGGG
jgi:hypothetical protein